MFFPQDNCITIGFNNGNVFMLAFKDFPFEKELSQNESFKKIATNFLKPRHVELNDKEQPVQPKID